MKRLFRYLAAAGLILAATFAVVWVLASQRAAPPPSGEVYRVVPDWPHLPEGLVLGQVAGIDVDPDGHVVLFHRAERFWGGEKIELESIASPVVAVLDAETGEVIEQWGADTFVMPHGLTIDREGNLWMTDVGLHQVFKYDRSGGLLLSLGERGVPGDDAAHFNMPTDVAVGPDGAFYVSDGYANSRITSFSAEGQYLGEWGTPGAGAGQFDVPHSIALDPQGRIYVADRGNARVQIFDQSGNFIEQLKDPSLGRPWAVRIDRAGNIYVVDGGDQNQFWPDRARVLKLDAEGKIAASFGAYGTEAGQFIWPHTIAIGPDGALYVGEVATGMRVQKFAPGSP